MSDLSETSADLAPIDIAELRRRLGEPGEPISQAELGRRCNTAASTINRYEADPSNQQGPLLALLHLLWDKTENREAA